MGIGRTTEDTYRRLSADIAKGAAKKFTHDRKVKAHGGKVAELLDMRNPKIRESAFPGSDFMGIIPDTTGSMSKTPVQIFEHIITLMSLLTQGGYTKQPALWFGAVGDYTSDHFPFQGMVNVESDLQVIAPILESFILEGGGGGGKRESYATMAWFLNNRFQIDEWKRREKGTLVFIGDEGLYDRVDSDEIYRAFGLTAQGETTEKIFEDLLNKYHVYLIRPGDASYPAGTPDGDRIEAQWKTLIGPQNVLHLPNAEDISPMCAAIMGYRNDIPVERINADLGSDEFTKAIVVAESGSSIAPTTNPGKSSIRRFTR